MSKYKLRTAILGLNDDGQRLLEAASKIDYFQIAAVADKDSKLAEKMALRYNCAPYDDYRRLIIENQFDCLLVAAGIYSCDEYIRTAMKKKFNILKLTPAARNFEEAAGFVQLADAENIKFAVANTSRFAPGFLALRQFLQEGRIEQIFLISAVCALGNRAYPLWQTDPKLAGGGVLLRNCYEIIDQIIWNFATPQQIYSLSTSQASDRQQRLYLTEDTAVVTMKFTDTLTGSLIASRTNYSGDIELPVEDNSYKKARDNWCGIGPAQKFMKIYGKNKILTVSDTGFVVSDGLGRISEEFKCDADKLCWETALLENFAVSILWPDENALCSSGRENLKNMAVIESAYLSARTGFPEEPGRILKRTGHYK